MGRVAVIGGLDHAQETTLRAYWVPKPGQRAGGSDLRDYLKRRLPEYMIPSSFRQLVAMPLTPTGKIDRRALPASEAIEAPEDDSASVAPRTPIEAEVAVVWADVLGMDAIGVHQDFFKLGGHSIRAMQVVSRLRDLYQIDLPLHAIFDAPTVAQLALQVTRVLLASEEAAESNLALEDPLGSSGPSVSRP